MHKIVLTAAIFGLSSTMAFAQATPVFADIDTDTSGEVSFTELQAAWPDFTQASFDSADTDASGGLNEDELAAIGASAATKAGNPAPAPDADAPTDAVTGTDATVGNPTGLNGTEAEDDDDDDSSGDTEGTESLSPTT